MMRSIATEQISTTVLREVKNAVDNRRTETLWVTMGKLEDCLSARGENDLGDKEAELILSPSAWDDFTSALAWHAGMTSNFVTWADFWVIVNNKTTQWPEFATEGDYRRFYGDDTLPCPEGLLGGVECVLGVRHGCDHTGRTQDGITVTWSRQNVSIG